MGARIAGELVASATRCAGSRRAAAPPPASRATREGLADAPRRDRPARRGERASLSVCPPQGALGVAREVAESGWAGIVRRGQPGLGRDPRRAGGRRCRPRSAASTRGIVGPPPGPGAAHPPLPRRAGRPRATWSALFTGTERDTQGGVGEKVGARLGRQAGLRDVQQGPAGARSAGRRRWPTRTAWATCWPPRAAAPGAERAGRAAPSCADGLAEVGWRWGPELDEIAATLRSAGTDPSAVEGLAAQLRRLAT